jgi:hypothetical protein
MARRRALGPRRLDRLMTGLEGHAGNRRAVIGLDRQRVGLGLICLRQTGQGGHGSHRWAMRHHAPLPEAGIRVGFLGRGARRYRP